MVCEAVETQTDPYMSVELEEIKQVESSYTLPKNLIRIDSEGYAHCKCGGHYKNKQDRNKHENTLMDQRFLIKLDTDFELNNEKTEAINAFF